MFIVSRLFDVLKMKRIFISIWGVFIVSMVGNNENRMDFIIY